MIVVFVEARVRGEQRHTSVLHAPTTPTCTQENISEYITLALTLDHVLEQFHSPCCLYWFTRCICSSLSPYLAVPSPLLHSHTLFSRLSETYVLYPVTSIIYQYISRRIYLDCTPRTFLFLPIKRKFNTPARASGKC